MVTAILTMVVVWCLFYGRISAVALALLCLGFGVTLVFLGRHKQTQFLTIDVLAQHSRLNKVNASLKCWTTLVLMILCVSSGTPIVGMFLAVTMILCIVYVGGLRLYHYVRLLALPVSFLMVSGLALLFEASAQRIGVLGIHVFGIWFCVSVETQTRAMLVMARALGAVSCLYLLSLTTPMSALIGVLRRAHCPDVIVDLMYLIYRYIFILLSMYHSMRDAAKSRLGYTNYRTSVRTTGNLYSNLLARSYRQANRNFDAMESRCYETEIRFLENREKITGMQVAVAIGITIFTLGLSLLYS